MAGASVGGRAGERRARAGCPLQRQPGRRHARAASCMQRRGGGGGACLDEAQQAGPRGEQVLGGPRRGARNSSWSSHLRPCVGEERWGGVRKEGGRTRRGGLKFSRGRACSACRLAPPASARHAAQSSAMPPRLHARSGAAAAAAAAGLARARRGRLGGRAAGRSLTVALRAPCVHGGAGSAQISGEERGWAVPECAGGRPAALARLPGCWWGP